MTDERTLREALPAPDFDATFDTTGRRPDGEAVEVALDAEALRLGDESIALDERLRATLAWVLPDRDAVLLELRSVVTALERTQLRLTVPVSEMPELAEVALVEQARGDAIEIDGSTMRKTLARVRGVLDTIGESWQPPGLAVARGAPLAPRERPAQKTLREIGRRHGLHLRQVRDGHLVAPRRYLAAAPGRRKKSTVLFGQTSPQGPGRLLSVERIRRRSPEAQRKAARTRGVFYGALVGAAAGTVVAFVGSGSLDLLVTLVVFCALGMAVGVTVAMSQPRLPASRLEAERLTLPNEETYERADTQHLVVAAEGLVLFDRTGHGEVASLRGSADGWRELLSAAWGLELPLASDVGSPPPWFDRVSMADAELSRFRYGVGALWIGAFGMRPGRVFSPELGRWVRCHVEARSDGLWSGDDTHILNDPEAADLATVANEVASPLPPSIFDVDHALWRARTEGGRCTLSERAGTLEIELDADTLRASSGVLRHDEIAALALDPDDATVLEVLSADNALALRCTDADSATSLRELLAAWRHPTVVGRRG